MIIFWVCFGLSVFLIFYAMIGYPFILRVIDSIKNHPQHLVDKDYRPTVTYMIVAHNEQKVILSKLENSVELDYPSNLLEILVASDNSTDDTNAIVTSFIKMHPERIIRLYESKGHKGKTNAQNEAQKTISSDIIVMTDANTIVQANAIKELVSYFTSDDIAYVCGKLVYSNSDSGTGNSESTYWNIDLSMRDIESRIKTITAGNGAIYACRNSEYIDFNPICCHDSSMPYAYALKNKRAIFNPNAIAVEKAGNNNEDEYKRKVRMNRIILRALKDGIKTINIFKYGWFSVFYFGHRVCRYLLWLSHIVAFLSSIALATMGSKLGLIMAILQAVAFLVAYLSALTKTQNKMFRLLGYYGMTIWAQIVGVWRIVTGKAKPIWGKAESTR